MAVVYWQLTVILTITIAFWIGVIGSRFARRSPKCWLRHLGLLMATFWTLWTVVMIFMPELMLIQLASTWVTFGINSRFLKFTRAFFQLRKEQQRLERDAKEAERRAERSAQEEARLRAQNARLTRHLEEILGNYEKATRDRLKTISESEFTVITDKAHQDVLRNAVRDANRCLCILSGWINDRVVNDELLRSFERALKSGVDIYLGFGYKNSEGQIQLDGAATRALRKLEGLQMKTQHLKRGRLYVAQLGTHEKILIKDDDLLVIGSHNWLSNKAHVNTEASLLVRNRSDVTKPERRRIQERIYREWSKSCSTSHSTPPRARSTQP